MKLERTLRDNGIIMNEGVHNQGVYNQEVGDVGVLNQPGHFVGLKSLRRKTLCI